VHYTSRIDFIGMSVNLVLLLLKGVFYFSMNDIGIAVKKCFNKMTGFIDHLIKYEVLLSSELASVVIPVVFVCLFVIILHSAASGHGISRTHFLPASSVT